MTDGSPQLSRRLGLVLLSLYGIGTTVGAGIFVLIGEIAGTVGPAAPMAFLLAGLLVAFAAMSFAEMASRFPVSAGEAVYVREGLGLVWLATLIGLMVALSGIVSSATIVRAFAGYGQTLGDLPAFVLIGGGVVLLTGLACAGIRESVMLASLVSVLEVAVLLVVVGGGLDDADWSRLGPDLIVPPAEFGLIGLFSGAVLAFYAFIGFEDMVNVAEEVCDVERTMPRAILITLVVTTLIYVGVALIAVLAMPVAELADSKAPVSDLFERTVGLDGRIISVIASVAVLNGALVQIIMVARVFYGLSRQGWLPAFLGAVSPRTHTPIVATVLAGALVLALSLSFPLGTLARITSLIVLIVFALVSLSLWRLKLRGAAHEGFQVPLAIPVLGTIVSFGVVGIELVRVFG